ncbi:hypothetical protein [Spiroplasma poulsonii]|nr:hypothetical protein [Spiroplasma poulsonii]UNF61531.1 hypothetical protein MNU24_06340 [Spiroplasma poulsonii]
MKIAINLLVALIVRTTKLKEYNFATISSHGYDFTNTSAELRSWWIIIGS